MLAIKKHRPFGITVAVALLALIAPLLIWFHGGESAKQAGRGNLVAPSEVDFKDLPIGNWITVSIPIDNQTGRVVTIFDIAPT